MAFGQGIWIPGIGVLAASIGIALFWQTMLSLNSKRDRFWLSVFWFSMIQSVQLSWLASTQYMGLLILLVYAFLCLGIGLQFGLLSFFISDRNLTVRRCLAAAGAWVWLEWLRTFFLTGFTWNPIGFALSDSPFSIQGASLFGVYGLSFWVIFVNMLALRTKGSWVQCCGWAVAVILPYAYGVIRQAGQVSNQSPLRSLSAAIVHTPFRPDQRNRTSTETYIPPLIQWEKIWEALEKSPPVDLIVMPESTVVLEAYRPYYSFPLVTQLWVERFGRYADSSFPPLGIPMSQIDLRPHVAEWRVSNAFIAQSIANHFDAHVIAGFEDDDGAHAYNSAFHFRPKSSLPARYQKRILVPIGEYVPFPHFDRLSQFLSEHFQISDSFAAGSEAKIFMTPIAAGISICLEETYSHIIREQRRKGAHFLVNISNDVWFPNTRLPRVHLEHARVRSVENGVSALRSCNQGITALIDYFGRPLAEIRPERDRVEVLVVSIPQISLKTGYTQWGDAPVLLAGMLFVFIGARRKSCP